jgi:phosphate transport system protein
MTGHTVKAFDAELQELTDKIVQMGDLVKQQIRDALRALLEHDAEIARQVVATDLRTDELQRQIEEQAILTIARRQPMAVDLREIVGALRIANALERIGDYAKNIGKRATATGTEFGQVAALGGLRRMADLMLAAFNHVLTAYERRDAALALKVWQGDQAIDAANNALFRQLLSYMTEDARNVPMGTHLLFCAKNIERMGDHATNIAETIYYIVEGVPLDAARPKEDVTSLERAPTGR